MKTTFQLDQYKVEFDVPDRSTRKGNEYRALIDFSEESPAFVFGEILEGYTRKDDINRDHFITELSEKPSSLNMEFSTKAIILNRFRIRSVVSSFPTDVDVKGHNGLSLKIGDHGYTAERFLIWLADDVVFDMYFFYKDSIEPIKSITESISFSTS